MDKNDPAFDELKKDIIALTDRSFNKVEDYVIAMLNRLQVAINQTLVDTEHKYNELEDRVKIIESKLSMKKWYDD